MKSTTLLVVLLFCLYTFGAVRAGEDTLPPAVQAELHAPLTEMGAGTYRRFGFSVYRASFWTSGDTWNKKKPYALVLRYTREVSKDTLVDTVIDDLRSQNVADDATIVRWHQILVDILSDVEDGDAITTLYLPGQKSPVFRNNKVISRIGDQAFIKAYLDIWLGPNADEDLRNKLLGKS